MPVVATNDVRFLARDGLRGARSARVHPRGHVLDDPRRPRRYSEQQYLKSPRRWRRCSPTCPKRWRTRVEIARRCNLELKLGKSRAAGVPGARRARRPTSYLRDSRARGLDAAARAARASRRRRRDRARGLRRAPATRARRHLPDGVRRLLPDRRGLHPLGAARTASRSARAAARAPARWSPTRSASPTSIRCAYDLLFERFLNPERVSMPDFDIDFCMDGRDEVIDYVARAYGRDRVAQIITYGTMAAKAVVRDVGRVLGHAYGFVDRIAKLDSRSSSASRSTTRCEQGAERTRARLLPRPTRRRARPASTWRVARGPDAQRRHARRRRRDRAVACSPIRAAVLRRRAATQRRHAVRQGRRRGGGLVKFDFLGLRTLTIIDWAVQDHQRAARAQRRAAARHRRAAAGRRGRPTSCCKRCETTAVFQLESRGMKDLIKRLKPDCFEDIVALVALFRPGPLHRAWSTTSSTRKHGNDDGRSTTCIRICSRCSTPTYGVIVYQEQVMQIAQVLAGYTLGGADLLRRAMGKKKPEEMAQAARRSSSTARRSAASRSAGAAHDLRPDGEVRGLRLQQVALGRLRAARRTRPRG